MRKLAFILGTMILLTGCQNISDIKEKERQREEIHITSHIDQVMMTESDAAKRLASSLGHINEAEIRVINNSNDLAEIVGVENSSYIVELQLSDSKESEEALQAIKAVVGEELQDFVDAARETEEEVYFTEKVIGDYGVIYYGVKGYQSSLYVISSQDSYLDEAKRNQIEAFCGEELIVSATTVGAEKSMVELSFPSYQERYFSIGLNNTTAYYQVFSDNNQKIEKVRMMINQYQHGYKGGILEEDKLVPLKRMLQEMQTSETDIVKVAEAIKEVVNQQKSHKEDKLGNLEYSINRKDANIYYEDLIEVVISFN